MKRINGLICILSLTALFGCAGPPKLSDNRRFPAKPKFTITPQPVAESAGLDFDAVYYLANTDIPGVASSGGNYFRFWPNGRVLVTFATAPPSPSEADSFRNAYLGYYRVNEGRVEMEFFAPDPAKHRWSYGRDSAIIQGNNLVVTRSQMGSHVSEVTEVFTKRQLDGLKRMPDW